MQAVIEVGGRVVNSYNDTKVSPGGSNFFVSLDSHSVSRPTIEKYHKELKNRGWIILDSLKDEYCKNGSRAAIFTEGKFRDIDVISISMAYDRDTVKRCSKT